MAEEKISFLLDILSKKIDRQVDNWNSLDQKLGLLSGFIATVIGAEVALMFKYLGLNTFSLSIIVLFISLVVVLIALWPREFTDPINMDIYYTRKFLKNNIVFIKNKSLADYKECYRRNSIVLKNKSLFFKVSIGIFILGILLLITGSYQLAISKSISVNNREGVTVNMAKDGDKPADPNEDVTPLKPNKSPGTTMEKGEKPVKPNDQPGNTMPFGETKGGIKLTK